MKRLKKTHKNLMFIESEYLYCLRHKIETSEIFEELFLSDNFDCGEGSEYDNICKDLRFFRRIDGYELKEISVEEYELCITKFGKE